MGDREIVPFTPEAVKDYLDRLIRFWRRKHQDGTPAAVYYIVAYQNVRMSLFGEPLPPDKDEYR